VQARGARVIPGLQTLWSGRTTTSKNWIEKAMSRKRCRLFAFAILSEQVGGALQLIIGVLDDAKYDARILLFAGLLLDLMKTEDVCRPFVAGPLFL
jgi:hypothetical protein